MRTTTFQRYTWTVACAIGVCLLPPAGAEGATFDDLSLPPDSYWNGADGSGGFTSGGLSFNNAYDQTFGSWEGWAYSNMTDTTTPGYGNQYSAITGGGNNASANYGVGYVGFTTLPTVSFPNPTPVQGAYFTNATYPYLSMRDGDAFAKKFGGPSGDDPDWFRLTITGKDGAGAVTGTKDFYLADYRFDNNAQDYLINQWTWVDLTGLGNNVHSLQFDLDSSDVGSFGMNTPAYFAMDDLTLPPEAFIPSHILPGQEFTATTLTRDAMTIDGILHVSGMATVGTTSVSAGASGVLDRSAASAVYSTNGLTIGAGGKLTVLGDGTTIVSGPQSYGPGAVLQIGGDSGSSPTMLGGSAAPAPEPSSVLMLLGGAVAATLFVLRRRGSV